MLFQVNLHSKGYTSYILKVVSGKIKRLHEKYKFVRDKKNNKITGNSAKPGKN